jgi:hypothetical protein
MSGVPNSHLGNHFRSDPVFHPRQLGRTAPLAAILIAATIPASASCIFNLRPHSGRSRPVR